jgi:hypothetical protein
MAEKRLFPWEEISNTLSRSPSGNCNFQYISALKSYLGKPEVALIHILTAPHRGAGYAYGAVAPSKGAKPVYASTQYAMYLFAQGSEDSITLKPYGPQLKNTIEAAGLGVVLDCGPAPNLLHNNKPGILYVWKVDHAACAKWWKVNVYGEWEKRETLYNAEVAKEAEEAKIKAELAKAEQKIALQETKIEAKHAEQALIAAGLGDPLPKKKLRWRCRAVFCHKLNDPMRTTCMHCTTPRTFGREKS